MTLNQVIIFKFRLSPGWFCLPSKLVISLPRTFKCKSNIKNQDQSLRTPYTTAKSQDQPQPLPAPEPDRAVPDNLAAPTYPEKAPDRLEISHGSKTSAQAVTGTDLCSIGIRDNLHFSDPRVKEGVTEYGCTVHSCGPGKQQTSRLAVSSLSNWSEVTQYPISLKQRTRKWHLTAAPSVYVRTPFLFHDRICLNLAR